MHQQQKPSDEVLAHERNFSNAAMMAVVTAFFLGLLILFCFLIRDNAVWLVVVIVFTVIVGIAFFVACYKVWAARKLKLAAIAAQDEENRRASVGSIGLRSTYTGMA